jgi:hypothetical protein
LGGKRKKGKFYQDDRVFARKAVDFIERHQDSWKFTVATSFPERLSKVAAGSQSLTPPGLPESEPKGSRFDFYNHYLDGKPVPPPDPEKDQAKEP